jgi:SpoVK/Ycf46/Vps4 family AAA+-type ATPase
MSRENCEKYVYCFDEFDYLLADILNGNQTNDAKADIQFKIHTLNQQLAAVKDNKELCDSIVKEIKDMMEAGTSDILTYPALLSELSGISSVTGRIIIATTNFIDRIPAALLRPGRFDLVMELGHFNSAEIRELLCKLYKPTTEVLAKLNRVTFPENKFTPSELILMSCKHPKLTDMVKALGGKFTGAKSSSYKNGAGKGVSMEEVEDMCKTS